MREWLIAATHRILKPRGQFEETCAFGVAVAMWSLALDRAGGKTRSKLVRDVARELAHFQQARRESEMLDPAFKAARVQAFSRGNSHEPGRPPCQRSEPPLRVAPFHIEGLQNDAGTCVPREAWHARLVFDRRISITSPVVRGTKITASLVVSLVASGCTWDEIFIRYPELTADDIRACIAQVLDDEQLEAAPWIAGKVAE